MEKRGQITIFIIIAVIIVALIAVIWFLYPSITSNFTQSYSDPNLYMKSCIENDFNDKIQTITEQGGSLNPDHYILYNDQKIKYLCYTNEYYKTCVMQQPMLLNSIESEAKQAIKQISDSCFSEMQKDFENRGYEINIKNKDYQVNFVPKRARVNYNLSLTLTKNDETHNYNSINVVMDNNLYELIMIANSILNWEARYGDAETTIYMDYYRNMKVEKKKQSDGSTIYIITDKNTRDRFQFASRSVAWPPGFG